MNRSVQSYNTDTVQRRMQEGHRQRRTSDTGRLSGTSIRWIGGAMIMVVLIITISLLINKTVSSASVHQPAEKCYRSVEIESGDSLWSIARQYYTSDWKDLESYIEEIKQFNGISNDTIQAGGYLAVPYYADR